MITTAAKMPANCPQNIPKFQHDIVALKILDFANPRTWEVAENKGSKRSFLGHGTWEGTENKTVAGNVRNRDYHGDKLPHHEAIFGVNFEYSTVAGNAHIKWRLPTSLLRLSRPQTTCATRANRSGVSHRRTNKPAVGD